MVLGGDGRGVRPVRPVEHDLLVRGTGASEHRVVVAVVEVAPEAGVGGWDVVASEDGGRHPQMVQLGKHLAVQGGKVGAKEEGGGERGEELVKEGERDVQRLAVTGHGLMNRLHVGVVNIDPKNRE